VNVAGVTKIEEHLLNGKWHGNTTPVYTEHSNKVEKNKDMLYAPLVPGSKAAQIDIQGTCKV
jgi:hypothetical protein